MSETIKLLLVEDNPGDARYIKEILKDVHRVDFAVEHAERMTKAIAYLDNDKFDVILLDLGLPDSHGFETFEQIHQHSPSLPVVILSGNKDGSLASRAVEAGAQDFQIKGEVDELTLARSIRYAIKRQVIRDKMEALKTKTSNERDTVFTPKVNNAEIDTNQPLKQRDNNRFVLLTRKYKEILETAIKRSSFDSRDDIAKVLQLMAKELGMAKAQETDLLDLHANALNSIAFKDKDAHKISQLVYIELLACIISHYYYSLFDKKIVSGKVMELELEY